MIQKCDGVKILDLEEKLEATGSEYIVTAEKSNNYKLPLESVADIVIGNSKFKAAIKDVYESSTPTAQNIIITYDNTTSSITLNNPTGIDSSRVVIKALDDDAEDSISVRAYDSQGNYSSITPTGISSSNGIDNWIIINNGYIAVHTPEGSDTGWTGTKNGLRFQCGICVGTA